MKHARLVRIAGLFAVATILVGGETATAQTTGSAPSSIKNDRRSFGSCQT